MNTNQYTQKTLEALQAAQQLAVEYQHNALEPEHLLHALASQEQGLIPQLLQKLNVDPGSLSFKLFGRRFLIFLCCHCPFVSCSVVQK